MIAQIRALATELQSRWRLGAAAGVSFGGDRDMYTALGYKKDLENKDYRDRYARGGISARIVEAFPKATFRGGFELVEDDDPQSITPFEETWLELERRLHVNAVMTRADILAGLGPYSVILLGAPGDLEGEMGSTSAENLVYLQPYGPDEVKVEEWDLEMESPRFGLPIMYEVERATNLQTKGLASEQKLKVHWTRIIHIADGILDEQIIGEPRLRRVWNLLDDLDKCTGGGSEAFWNRAHQGYTINVPPETKMEEGDMDDLEEEVTGFINGFRRFMRLRGAEVEALGSDVANFANQVDAILTQVSGATGIPKRILLGSERGELASMQDRLNWQERVQDRREQYAEPQIIQPFVERLMMFGVLPEAEFEIRWESFQDLTEQQKAEIADKLSKVNTQMGSTIITGSEIRDRILDLPPLEETGEEGEIVEEGGEEDTGAVETEEVAAAEKKSSPMWIARVKRNRGWTRTKSPTGKRERWQRQLRQRSLQRKTQLKLVKSNTS